MHGTLLFVVLFLGLWGIVVGAPDLCGAKLPRTPIVRVVGISQWRMQWNEREATLKTAKPGDKYAVAALLKEIAILKTFETHPNLLETYGYCESRSPFVIVEFLDGNLRDLWDKQRTLTPRRQNQVLLGAAVGLRQLHMRGIVHGNVAARNIFLTKDFAAKLGGVSAAGDYSPTQPARALLGQENDVRAFGMIVLEAAARQVHWTHSDSVRPDQFSQVAMKADSVLPRASARVVTELLECFFAPAATKEPHNRLETAIRILEKEVPTANREATNTQKE